jgi:prepilin-type N-terminal cleavage/methylation domain-containing protein
MKDDKGFTLLEVLIAITILSLIILGIVSITDDSQRTAENVIAEDLDLLQVETAFSRLEWDISHAYSPLYFSHAMEPTGLTPQEGDIYNSIIDRYSTNERFAYPSFDGYPVPNNRLEAKESLTFFSMSNRRKYKNIKQSYFAWVRYEIVNKSALSGEVKDPSSARAEAQGGENILVRKVIANDVFNPELLDWDDVKSQVLLRNVEKVIFEFWNPANRKWTDNLSTIKDGQHVIRGMKVTLTWLDYDGLEREMIRIFRPLFPNFSPENLYQFLYPTTNTTTTNPNENGAGDVE